MLDPLMTFAIFAFVFGAMVGSFLNVVIGRMPEGKSVVYPGSHCPHCQSPIRPYDNVPILAWFWLRARCRDCHTPISSLYPTIELMCGLLALLLYRHIFVDYGDLILGNLLAFFVYFAFIAALVAESFIDIRYYIIPDALSIYAAPFAIVAMWGLGYFPSDWGITWQESVLGAFFGGGSLALVAGLWWLIRRYEGMGWGDVKLLLLIGAVLGPWPALPFVFMFSATSAIFLGIPIALLQGRGLRMALPFGPFLALASIVWLFHGPDLMHLWLPHLF